ncbi:MAG: hypothetical protein K5656_03350 [Lachnospiraceae bacterium]|nr:hypothetical protein [Lachnospiraceae bacterium]
MSSITEKLRQIYATKVSLKSSLDTESDVFEVYPSLVDTTKEQEQAAYTAYTTVKEAYTYLEGAYTNLDNAYTNLDNAYTYLDNAYSDLNTSYNTLDNAYTNLNTAYGTLEVSYTAANEEISYANTLAEDIMTSSPTPVWEKRFMTDLNSAYSYMTTDVKPDGKLYTLYKNDAAAEIWGGYEQAMYIYQESGNTKLGFGIPGTEGIEITKVWNQVINKVMYDSTATGNFIFQISQEDTSDLSVIAQAISTGDGLAIAGPHGSNTVIYNNEIAWAESHTGTNYQNCKFWKLSFALEDQQGTGAVLLNENTLPADVFSALGMINNGGVFITYIEDTEDYGFVISFIFGGPNIGL